MRFAINPLQWWATDEGWLNFLGGPELPQLAAEVSSTGFTAISAGLNFFAETELPQLAAELAAEVGATGLTAISAGIVPEMDTDAYATVLSAAGLVPAPGYFSAPLADHDAMTYFVSGADALARAHAALDLSELYVASNLSPDTPRVMTPAQGIERDPARLARIAESLKLVCETVNRHGVTPCLHQHVGTWIETEDEFEWLLEQIDPADLALGPDTGHMAWAGIDPVSFVTRHRDRIRTIHVKDVQLGVAADGRKRGSPYPTIVKAGVFVEPGRGDLDLRGVFNALGAREDMWAIIEVDRPDLPSPQESACACAAWAREAEQR